MIFLFQKTKLFWVFASVLWTIAVVVGRLTVFTEYASTMAGILIPAGVGVVGLYAIYFFSLLQASKMHQAYHKILSEDCDADYFVEVYQPLRERGKKLKKTFFITESTYATGLNLAGRSAEALSIAKDITAHKDFPAQRPIDRADAYVDIGIYSIAVGDLNAAYAAIEEAKKIQSTLMIGTAEYNRLYREIERLKHRTDLVNGIYDGARSYFEESGREYTTTYTKVNRMNTLAQIYRATGETELLRKCLVYIDENGGTLDMAKRTREELKNLPAESAAYEESDHHESNE